MENSFLNEEGNFMRKWSCAFYLPCNFVWLELPINFWWTDFIMMWWALIDWFWQAQIGIDLRCVAYHFGTWKISWFYEWIYYLHAFVTLLITWKIPMGIVKLMSYYLNNYGRWGRFEAADLVIWSSANWSTSLFNYWMIAIMKLWW